MWFLSTTFPNAPSPHSPILFYQSLSVLFKIFLTFACSIKDALYLLEYWPKTYVTVCSTWVPGPFPFPRHEKGPRNEVDSVLLEVPPLRPFTFFVHCRMRPLILGLSVGRSEKKKSPPKKGEEVSNWEAKHFSIITCGAWKWQDTVKLKREQRKKDD